MKKYLLPALLALFLPIVASGATPKPGHYEGTATDVAGIVHRKFSFDLTAKKQLFNLHVSGAVIPHSQHVFGHFETFDKFRFNTFDIAAIQFFGHGKWHKDTECAGDFRERPAGSDHNTYYTWHAHWRHE